LLSCPLKLFQNVVRLSAEAVVRLSAKAVIELSVKADVELVDFKENLTT
jgi:hypothetical protein